LTEPQKVSTSYTVKCNFLGFYTWHTEVPAATAETFSFHNSFTVKRSVFEEIRGFDCINFPMRFSEVDFAHRLHTKRYRTVVNPTARVWHDLDWSLGSHRQRESLLYVKKQDHRSQEVLQQA